MKDSSNKNNKATPQESKKKEDSDAVRIGIFVCDCGINIAGFIDVPAVVDYARTLPNVKFVQENMYTCSDSGITEIKNGIKEHNLNRVIVASCTPRTHAPLFMAACEAAGLNKYLFEFVNIRDQCSWIHMKEREWGTEKAKRLIQMGVAKASLLAPLTETEAPVEPRALVIGGGVAGLSAANSIARQGFEVHIVERERQFGGKLLDINNLFPNDIDARELIDSLIKKAKVTGRVVFHLNSNVTNVEGYIGNFDVTISGNNGKQKANIIKVGTVIIATGSKEYKPKGLYGYGKLKEVITQLEFEKKFKTESLKGVKSVAMIQCVGARGQHVTYCSKTCCMVAVKNARMLKKRFPGIDVTIYHRGMQTYGQRNEMYYLKAREEGIRFVRFEPERPPDVSQKEGQLHVKAYSPALRRNVDLDCDLLILSTPQIQHDDAKQTAQMFKIPLGQEGFFFEAHVKLRPLDFATDGVFLCGNARGPASVGESVLQALGAASRAAIPLAKGQVRATAITAQVNEEECIGCGNCVASCPYNAIELQLVDERLKANVNEAMCKGCGTCVASCYNGAMQQQGFTDKQLLSMVDALCKAYGGV
jgi:heterodisulfide reductase subunit A